MNIIEAETVWGRWVKMLLLCLLGIFFAPLLLWLGYKRMQNMPEDDPNCKFLKKILLGGLLFIVIGFGYLVWKLMPEDGEHAAHVPWLPTAASDISYYRKAFDRELYEYRISENDFRSLYHLEVAQEKQPETAGAQAPADARAKPEQPETEPDGMRQADPRAFPFAEIAKDRPVTVTRYASMLPGKPESEFTATVSNGLHAERVIQTLSGKYKVSVTFDRDRERAYVSSVPVEK